MTDARRVHLDVDRARSIARLMMTVSLPRLPSLSFVRPSDVRQVILGLSRRSGLLPDGRARTPPTRSRFGGRRARGGGPHRRRRCRWRRARTLAAAAITPPSSRSAVVARMCACTPPPDRAVLSPPVLCRSVVSHATRTPRVLTAGSTTTTRPRVAVSRVRASTHRSSSPSARWYTATGSSDGASV